MFGPPPQQVPAPQMQDQPDHQEWTTGIFGCFEDIPTCFIGLCCPCILVGRYTEILGQGAITCPIGASMYHLVQIMTGCGCLLTAVYRTHLRSKFSLPEKPCGDFCTEFWCHLCSVCQVYRELSNRGIDPTLGYPAVRRLYEDLGAPTTQCMQKC